jgi:hypothetical protein
MRGLQNFSSTPPGAGHNGRRPQRALGHSAAVNHIGHIDSGAGGTRVRPSMAYSAALLGVYHDAFSNGQHATSTRTQRIIRGGGAWGWQRAGASGDGEQLPTLLPAVLGSLTSAMASGQTGAGARAGWPPAGMQHGAYLGSPNRASGATAARAAAENGGRPASGEPSAHDTSALPAWPADGGIPWMGVASAARGSYPAGAYPDDGVARPIHELLVGLPPLSSLPSPAVQQDKWLQLHWDVQATLCDLEALSSLAALSSLSCLAAPGALASGPPAQLGSGLDVAYGAQQPTPSAGQGPAGAAPPGAVGGAAHQQWAPPQPQQQQQWPAPPQQQQRPQQQAQQRPPPVEQLAGMDLPVLSTLQTPLKAESDKSPWVPGGSPMAGLATGAGGQPGSPPWTIAAWRPEDGQQ